MLICRQCIRTLCGFALFALSSVAAAADAETASVRVVTEDLYPLSYVDAATGEVKGIATEMIRTVLGEAGITYEIELRQWPEAYEEALNKPNTVIFSMARIPEREDKFIWLHKINDFNYRLYSPDQSLVNASREVLLDCYVAVTRGDFSNFILREYGFTNFIYIKDNERTMELLAKDQIDLVFANELYILQNQDRFPVPLYALQETITDMDEAGLFFAANPATEPAIIERLQAAFASEVDSETYDRLLMPYLPATAAGRPGHGRR